MDTKSHSIKWTCPSGLPMEQSAKINTTLPPARSIEVLEQAVTDCGFKFEKKTWEDSKDELLYAWSQNLTISCNVEDDNGKSRIAIKTGLSSVPIWIQCLSALAILPLVALRFFLSGDVLFWCCLLVIVISEAPIVFVTLRKLKPAKNDVKTFQGCLERYAEQLLQG